MISIKRRTARVLLWLALIMVSATFVIGVLRAKDKTAPSSQLGVVGVIVLVCAFVIGIFIMVEIEDMCKRFALIVISAVLTGILAGWYLYCRVLYGMSVSGLGWVLVALVAPTPVLLFIASKHELKLG